MKGSFDIVSNENGLEFTVEIPLEVPQRERFNVAPGVARHHVILLTENELYKKHFAFVIQKCHMHLHCAQNVSEVFTMIKSNNFDIVVVDHKLQCMESRRVVRKIQRLMNTFAQCQTQIVLLILLNAVESKQSGSHHPLPRIPIKSFREQVVIVDDETFSLLFMEELVMSTGERSITCIDNGKEALDYIMKEHNHIGIVFMDNMMPDIYGTQVIASIRRNEQEAKMAPVPIVMVSGEPAEFYEREALLNGANMYLQKPVGLQELKQVIADYKRDY